jgi:hypothetical protein
MAPKFFNLCIAACAALFATVGQAAPITVDGNIADWGINANGTVAGWAPNAGILYIVEDQTGNRNTYLNPGYGGQAYDAEAMYLTWDTNNLYLGLITGHDPLMLTANGNYGGGDFAIDFGRNGSWEFGVLTKNRSNTLSVGDIVSTSNANWAKGLWASPGHTGPSTMVTHVNSGTEVGTATVVWNEIIGYMGNLGATGSSRDKHWFYEVAIPVSAFGSYWSANNPKQSFDVQWTMDCANDIITLDPPVNVPEPASAALLLAGVGLLIGQRRRISRSMNK